MRRLLEPIVQLRLWAACAGVWARCVQTSQRLHVVYKKVRVPFHGSYFAVATYEAAAAHSIFCVVPGALLVLLVVGWLLEEEIP